MKLNIQKQREQIKTMRKQGMTQKAIAEKMGCSIATVQKCLKDNFKSITIKKCVVCGQDFEVPGKLHWMTCRNKACVAENRRRLTNNYTKKEEASKIRPYTETSNILIIQDLERGWSIQQIADMYDRDPADLKRHISKLLQDGTAGRIKRMLTAYRRHNTLARGSGLM